MTLKTRIWIFFVSAVVAHGHLRVEPAMSMSSTDRKANASASTAPTLAAKDPGAHAKEALAHAAVAKEAGTTSAEVSNAGGTG